MWWRRKIPKVIPEELISYHSEIASFDWSKNQEFIVFDCETTGLNPKKDLLLSIGAVKISHNKVDVEQAFHEFVHQKNYKGEAAPVHGIGHQDIQTANTEKDVVLRFIEFIGNKPLIGHHVGFDFKMISNSMKRHWKYPLRNKQLDTVDLVREVLPSHHKNKTLPSQHFSLDYLCDLLQIPIEDRHTALGDAYLTAVLFLSLFHSATPSKQRALFH